MQIPFCKWLLLNHNNIHSTARVLLRIWDSDNERTKQDKVSLSNELLFVC